MNIGLLPIDAALRASLDSQSLGANPELIHTLIEQTTVYLAQSPRAAPWLCYLAMDEGMGVVVGTCGFKGAPDALRQAEIAYGTFPGFEGKGYATAMARALVSMARDASDDVGIIAHTLPEANASGSVLRKVGLRFVGEVVDPEDGPVWRWELDPR